MTTLATPDQLLIAMGIVRSPAFREAKQRQKILTDQRESARIEYVYVLVRISISGGKGISLV